MKAFRELTITGPAEEVVQVITRILESIAGDWERDLTSEERLTPSVTGKMYCFVCSQQGALPRAALWLHQDTPAHVAVSNVFPILKGSLTHAEYNAIVEEFHRRFVEPAAIGTAVKVSLTDDTVSIENWVTPDTAELLRRFARLANQSTGTTHPLDEERWFAFLWAAHNERSSLTAEMLGRWLEEDEGWTEEHAFNLALEYEKGRALLAFSAEAA